MNQKDLFFKYLAEMNLEMIQKHFDEEIDYFGVSKELFIERLKYIFQYVNCYSDNPVGKISTKKQKNRYQLSFGKEVGTKVKFYLEEKAGKLVKLYHFKNDKYKVTGLEEMETNFIFGADERNDFVVTEEYLHNVSKCEQAVNEFYHTKPLVINYKELKSWKKKYKKLYKRLKRHVDYSKYVKFLQLYFGQNMNLRPVKRISEINEAIKQALLIKDEIDEFNWVIDYQNLYYCCSMIFGEFTLYNQEYKLINCIYENILFQGEEFYNVFRFNQIAKKLTTKIYRDMY